MKNGILIILSFLIIGCASHGPVFKEKVDKMKITIPLESYSLVLSDARDKVSDRDIILNPITFGGEQDSVSAPAPENLETEFRSIINQSKIKGERDVKFHVEIVKGIQTFHSSRLHEFEYVEVILKISAFDASTNQLIDQTSSKSWGEKKSFNATYKRINRMYLTAFRQAFKSGVRDLNI